MKKTYASADAWLSAKALCLRHYCELSVSYSFYIQVYSVDKP